MLCKCNQCGLEVSKEGNKYINGHNRRERTKENDESVRRAAEKITGRTKENDKGRRSQAEKMSKYMKNGGAIHANSFVTEECYRIRAEYMKNGGSARAQSFVTKEGRRSQAEKQTEYMKNGGSVYALSFNTNPSKLQVETWKITSLVCPYVYLNYPVYRGKEKKNYSIDIGIPKLDIAIEVDGSYWHQDKEKDLKRQKELEEDGWKFIRYIDIVPTKEQVEKDIKEQVGIL